MISDPQSPVCRKPTGGVAAVQLASARNVSDACFDTDGNSNICTFLRFADEQAVMQCRLLEDRSSFTETLRTSGNAAAVTHTLRLTADRNLAEAWLQPRFAAEILASGAVAAITLADGRRFVAGVSHKFGAEQPLRLKTLTADSGCKPQDEPSVTMILESTDTAFAALIDTP